MSGSQQQDVGKESDAPANGDPSVTDEGTQGSKETLADGSKPDDKVIPYKRFQSQTQDLRHANSKISELEAQLQDAKKRDVFTPGEEDGLDTENIAKMIDSRNENMKADIAQMVADQLGTVNKAALGLSEQSDIQAVKDMFGERFEESRDMDEIKVIQEDYPEMNAVDAFRMLDHQRLMPEVEHNQASMGAVVDTASTLGAPVGQNFTGVDPQVERLAKQFGMDPKEYQDQVNKLLTAKGAQQ